MAFNYSGNPAGGGAEGASPNPGLGNAPIATMPSDGDADNSASIQQFVKTAFDFMAWSAGTGASSFLASLLARANTWTAGNVYNSGATFNGASGDTNAAILSTAAVTNRKLEISWFANGGTTGSLRAYLTTTGIELAGNATWSGTVWASDDNTKASWILRLTFGATTTTFNWQWKAATASSWADNAWSAVASIDGTTGLLTIQGGATATTGNFTATAGSYIGQHVVGNSATPTKTLLTAAGATATATATGTDISGIVTLTPQGAGLGSGDQIQINFATAFALAPNAVILTPLNAATSANAPQFFVDSAGITNQHWTISCANIPTGGTAYGWYYVVIG